MDDSRTLYASTAVFNLSVKLLLLAVRVVMDAVNVAFVVTTCVTMVLLLVVSNTRFSRASKNLEWVHW